MRDLAEAQYRFNCRFDLKAIRPATLAAVATGPRPARWHRLDETRRSQGKKLQATYFYAFSCHSFFSTPVGPRWLER
jgi:hypothetical protein